MIILSINTFEQFRALHNPENPLILVNCWNVATARLLEENGQPAIATSSYAVADSLGYPDGEKLPRELLLLLIKNICREVHLPVTVDIETGYGEDVLTMIQTLLAIGVVGINLEDQRIGAAAYELIDLKEQAKKIASIRQFCQKNDSQLFINARTDVFFQSSEPTIERCKLALERTQAYSEAGANCIFIPGLNRADLIDYFVSHSPLPVNVMYTDQSPDLDTLVGLGVSRISYGPTSYFQAATDFRQRLAQVGRNQND
ncbi:isocitrate lyase/PEP mutase family protein [Enterococcus gallinarum]|uniref:isocitrate lyase/PEP mutase family protein n=1 Tax=Enterococcus gallinarum TaxID=1353 RepID=UPI001D1745F4|nr:isocitrate lyase/phosphoenolpyruvate mutase family protein [Enterococcus gallinarum]MCC4044857.1 isocitrate lyase/phosphoenolpyruvate mutase family protein [Enterococcus gallinarum]